MLGETQLPAFDRYDRVSVVGQGGLATVYRAHDTLLDREVAVKVFSTPADTRRIVKLQENEARRAAALDFPSLVRLYDVGSGRAGDSLKVYLVMEYVRGGDLGALLEQRSLSVAEVAGIGHDLAGALDFIHKNSLLHRDIKPANVLLEEPSRHGRLRAKLTDLGIASVIGSDPGSGTTHGTAAYLAPEQVEGEDPSEASDAYGLGLVLLEALTGSIEFPGDRDATVVARLERDPFIPATLPERLQRVLRGLTARAPADRMRLPEAMDLLEKLLAETTNIEHVSIGSTAEHLRLRAVRRYGVANDLPDEALGRIRGLAQRLLSTPIAFVGIVDEDKVWVKNGRGVGYRQVDRDHSPSALAVEQQSQVVIPDATVGEWRTRFAVIDELGIGSIVAAPLTTTDGFIIGSLVACDTAPRVFSSEELEDLSDLAALAMRELEVRLAARRAVFGR